MPVSNHAMIFVTAMPRLAASAAKIAVLLPLCPPDPASFSSLMPPRIGGACRAANRDGAVTPPRSSEEPAAPTLLYLSESDVRAAFTADVAHASQHAAFTALGRGEALLPARLLLPGRGDDVAFCYAARAEASAPAVSKFGSVHAGNVDAGLPAVHALVTVLDPTTGVPTCVMAGTTLTTRRTAAASAVAMEALWSPDSSGRDDVGVADGAGVGARDGIGVHVAIVGSGVQAEAHAHALCAVGGEHTVGRIRLAARDRASADELVARWHTTRPEGAPDMELVDTVEQACADADVIAVCTTSTTPVLEATWVRDGALVISVGSFSAERSEVPSDLVAQARVVVDDRETALADNGCVVAALMAGVLETGSVETLGEVLVRDAAHADDDDAERHVWNDDSSNNGVTNHGAADSDAGAHGERRPRVTLYASVGIGLQDAAAAVAVQEAAQRAGVGTPLPL